MSNRRLGLVVCVAALGGLVIGLSWKAAPVPGAPVPPNRAPRIIDPTRSMARLKEIRVSVQPMPVKLQEREVTSESVTEKVQAVLTDAGFTLSDDEKSPQLRFEVYYIADDLVPDAAAFVISMSLWQNATVERLEETFFVPTSSHVALGIERASRMEKTLHDTAEATVKLFADEVRRATAGRNDVVVGKRAE